MRASVAANNNFDEAAELSPEARVAALEAELAEHKDRLLRALAEAENTRRRAQRERDDATKYAISGFAKSCCQPRTICAAPSTACPRRRSGMSAPAACSRGSPQPNASSCRCSSGTVSVVSIRMGERFDHNLHQAIFEVEHGDQPPGTIVEVLQPGYLLHDRLLRPAMVGVAKPPAKPAEPL